MDFTEFSADYVPARTGVVIGMCVGYRLVVINDGKDDKIDFRDILQQRRDIT